MANHEFATAAVIGTGMMGPGIALTFALGGLHVTILGRSADNAGRALERARAQVRLLTGKGLIEPDHSQQVAELLSASTEFDRSVAAADIVVESVPEDMALKQAIFAHLDGLARPQTLLASNTSGLSITAVASKCSRPERVLTTHFWNPAHLMPLVEIVKGDRTSDDAVEAARALLVACGKAPVVVRKDRPGQLGNRLQMALVREAVNIVAEGIATAEDVDSVAMNGLGLRMPAYGILEHQDIVGLKLGLSVLEYVVRDLYNEPRAPEYFRELVDRGETGGAAGKGFYDWSVKSADEVRARRDAFMMEVLRWRRSS